MERYHIEIYSTQSSNSSLASGRSALEKVFREPALGDTAEETGRLPTNQFRAFS
jgi:hypothetical protein